jgi:hypothetical protein
MPPLNTTCCCHSTHSPIAATLYAWHAAENWQLISLSRLHEKKNNPGFSSRPHNLFSFVSNLILFTLSTTDVVKIPILEHGESTVFAHRSRSLSFSWKRRREIVSFSLTHQFRLTSHPPSVSSCGDSSTTIHRYLSTSHNEDAETSMV